MDDGIPQPPERGSLLAAVAGAARRGAGSARASLANRPAVTGERRDWIVAAGVAALIAAGPLFTIAGAWVIERGVRGEVTQLQEQAAPRAAAAKTAAQDRAVMVATLRRPGLGSAAEALARAMPVEAVLLRAERGRDGRLEVDISAPDPDKLRAAIRAEPALAGLRDVGQQRGDLMMTVSFREQGE